MLVVPGQYVGADRGGERQVAEELVDAVLVDPDVGGAEPVEVLAAVLPVIAEQRVDHQMAQVQDGAVDVEDDAELLLGVGASHPLVVGGEFPHPVRAGPVHRIDRGVIPGIQRRATRVAWFEALARQDWGRCHREASIAPGSEEPIQHRMAAGYHQDDLQVSPLLGDGEEGGDSLLAGQPNALNAEG
jgi:hypothetical protein